MTRIAINTAGQWRDDQWLDDMGYAQSFRDLALALHAKDATLFVTRDMTMYEGGNRFRRGWRFDDSEFRLVRDAFDVDLIFNKYSKFIPSGNANVLNQPAMDMLCNNKIEALRLFPDLFPRTAVIHSSDDLIDAGQYFVSSTVVLKPAEGFGGRDVWIGPAEKIASYIVRFPSIAQEFIDTSQGIPGLVDTYHDFRMIIADGELILTFIRAPRTRHSLVSNPRKGGIMMPVPLRQCPADAKALIAPIDAKLCRFGHRIYSIDCGRQKDGRWMLIELNAPPGQHSRLDSAENADYYFKKLTDLLLRAAMEHQRAVPMAATN